MWYYVKDGRKVGPISDAAMMGLVSSGKVGRQTKVWTPHQKDWCAFEQSSLFLRMSSGQA